MLLKPISNKRIKNIAVTVLVIGVFVISYNNLQWNGFDSSLDLMFNRQNSIAVRTSGQVVSSPTNQNDINDNVNNVTQMSDKKLNSVVKSVVGAYQHPKSVQSIFKKLLNFLWWSSGTLPFLETSAASTTETNILLNNFGFLEPAQRMLIVEDVLEDTPEEKYLFVKQVFGNLYRNRPRTENLDRYKHNKKVSITRYQNDLIDNVTKDALKHEDPGFAIFSETYLSDFLQLTENELSLMAESHSSVIRSLPQVNTKQFYKGNGIVYVGGGNFNFLTLLSIKTVRDLGSKTPIEVLIPSLDEFDANLCFKVFPRYNAKCLLLPKILRSYEIKPDSSDPKRNHVTFENNVFRKIKIKGYQYKVLALLLSSFENVLFLDSDNIPARNPDKLFKTNPFKKHGMVVWPDYWKRSTSPLYYQIANITVNKDEYLPKYNEMTHDYEPVDYSGWPKDKIPFHQFKGTLPDPSSESGQLMVNKNTHLHELILSLYYNLYGPSHYYPLFSQGSAGEGDKETFIAACVALGGDFYQVKHFLKAMGHFLEGEFVGTAMGQYNPMDDYQKNLSEEIFFVHANFPKLNPWDLKKDWKVKNKKDGKRHRLYGNAIKQNIQYDFELLQWRNMDYFLCQMDLELKTFELVNHGDLCKEITQQLDFLQQTSHLTED